LNQAKPDKKIANDQHYRDVIQRDGQAPLRALSFVLAIVLAGCIFWDPSRFAAKTSELEIWHGFLLMWAVCAGIIHGVGFRPRAVHWQGIFCPLIADIVLVVGLFFFFFE
jgi:cyd operon protein YbgE